MQKSFYVYLVGSFVIILLTSSSLSSKDHICPSFSFPDLDTNIVEHKKLYTAQLLITRAMPDKAIPILLEILQQKSLNADFETFCKVYLTEAYRQKLEYDKGEKILKESLLQPNLSDYNRALIYTRLAASYHERKDYEGVNRLDSMLKYSNLNLALSEKNKYEDLIASTQNELGQYYLRTVHNDTIAIDYFNKALQKFIKLGMFRNAFYVAFNVSQSYLNIGEADKALQSLDQVEKLLPLEGNKNFFMYWHEKKGKIYSAIGESDKAYAHMKVAYSYQRNYFNSRTRVRIREMIAKYDLTTKEQQIYKEQERIKNLLILFVILILAGTFTFYNLNLKKKLIRSENEKLKIQLESKNRELVSSIGNMIGINKVYSEIKEALKKDDPKEILAIINQNVKTDENWIRFNYNFEKVYPDFYRIIHSKFPQLSKNDLKLTALLLMKLSTSEIAGILNISPAAVSKKRNRFRSKLNLEPGRDIQLFIRKAFEEESNKL